MREKSLLVLTRQFRNVQDELVGENVRIVRITDATRKKIAEHNTHQMANWDLFYGGYDHAFVNTYDAEKVTVSDTTVFNGQKQTHETQYDLSGATVPNDSPMGEKSETSSHLAGNRLVTTWETEGAVAGTKVVRTETRYLSDDGKTLFLESSRAGKEPMVIVFDRK